MEHVEEAITPAGLRQRGSSGEGGESHEREEPSRPEGLKHPSPKAGRPHIPPCVRRLFSASPVLLVITASLFYAWQQTAARDRRPLGNPVPQMLDSEALHHAVLMVSNLTLAASFYAEVLGGQKVELGPPETPAGYHAAVGGQQAGGAQPATSRLAAGSWLMLSFGNCQLLLAEDVALGLVSPAPERQPPQQRIALRMAASAEPRAFVTAVQGRLHAFPELSHSVRCEVGSPAPSPLQVSVWLVVACRGPDDEVVEFWKPSPQIAKAFQRARKAWIASASDGRGRDLFE